MHSPFSIPAIPNGFRMENASHWDHRQDPSGGIHTLDVDHSAAPHHCVSTTEFEEMPLYEVCHPHSMQPHAVQFLTFCCHDWKVYQSFILKTLGWSADCAKRIHTVPCVQFQSEECNLCSSNSMNWSRDFMLLVMSYFRPQKGIISQSSILNCRVRRLF